MARSAVDIALVPVWLLRPLCADSRRRWHLNLALSGAAVALFFLCFPAALLTRIPHVCLMQALAGIPCPGCGILTSLFALARGDLGSCWRANPAGTLVGALVLAQVPAHALALLRDSLSKAMTRATAISGTAVLAVLLVVWGIRLFHLAAL